MLWYLDNRLLGKYTGLYMHPESAEEKSSYLLYLIATHFILTHSFKKTLLFVIIHISPKIERLPSVRARYKLSHPF